MCSWWILRSGFRQYAQCQLNVANMSSHSLSLTKPRAPLVAASCARPYARCFSMLRLRQSSIYARPRFLNSSSLSLRSAKYLLYRLRLRSRHALESVDAHDLQTAWRPSERRLAIANSFATLTVSQLGQRLTETDGPSECFSLNCSDLMSTAAFSQALQRSARPLFRALFLLKRSAGSSVLHRGHVLNCGNPIGIDWATYGQDAPRFSNELYCRT